MLTNLLATAGGAVGVAAPGPGATALQEVLRTITIVLGAGGLVPGGRAEGLPRDAQRQFGAKKAFAVKPFVLMRTLKKTVTVRFSKSVATRMKKGGFLKISALTSFSTLKAATKTVRLARVKR